MQKTDILVVGTGPGSAVLAADLARSGVRVTILERGKDRDFGDGVLPRLGALDVNFIGGSATLLRGLSVGGSSNLYFGTGITPPYERFDAHGIDLRDAAGRVMADLPVAPLATNAIGPRAERLSFAAKRLGYDWQWLPKLMHHDRVQAGEHPLGARWNAREKILEAVRHGAELRSECRVESVLTSNGRAEGVVVVEAGQRREYRAERVILAAGAVGTAAILARSGLPWGHGAFFCDPLVAVIGFTDEEYPFDEFAMTGGGMFAGAGMLTDMHIPFPIFAAFGLAATNPLALFKHKRALTIMVKIGDEARGSIDGREHAERDFSAADRKKMFEGIRYARNILEAAGAKSIFSTPWTSAHPGGTLKLGTEVDQNLQLPIAGLYACDASVLPAPWGLPPTLTLASLGRYLAARLTGKMPATEPMLAAGN